MNAKSDPPNLISRFDPHVLTALSGLDLKARYLVEGFLQGIHASPFHGISVEFSEYRDYQPGDDLRHLDWQLYARSDRLCVKKYTQETNVRFYVVCDTSASMTYRSRDAWGSKLEVARVVAAAITSMLLGQNDAVGLIALPELESVRRPGPAHSANSDQSYEPKSQQTVYGGSEPATRTGTSDSANSGQTYEPRSQQTVSSGWAGAEFIRPSQKPSQFGLMLNHLQALRPGGGPRLAELLQHVIRLIHRRSVVLFFSDFLEPAETILPALQELRFNGHECLVFQVLDRDEMEFPFQDGTIFEDLESGVRRSINPVVVRERYLERFNAFMQRHREQFRTLEMPYCRIETHTSPWEALVMYLIERKRML